MITKGILINSANVKNALSMIPLSIETRFLFQALPLYICIIQNVTNSIIYINASNKNFISSDFL